MSPSCLSSFLLAQLLALASSTCPSLYNPDMRHSHVTRTHVEVIALKQTIRGTFSRQEVAVLVSLVISK